MSRVVIASIVTLIILALLTTGIYFYQKYSIILLDPMKGVPQDAAFIVEVKKPASSLHQFFTGNKNSTTDAWLKSIGNNFLQLDSLIKEDGDAEDIWKKQSIVISAHLVNATHFDYLFLSNLPRGWSEGKLKKYIEKYWKINKTFTKREYENVNIYESQIDDATTFTFASTKSIAIFSFTPLLVESAIGQLKQGDGITQSRPFKKVLTPAVNGAETTNISLYISYPTFSDFISALNSENKNQFFNLTSSFARWSGLALISSGSNREGVNDEPTISFKGNAITFDTTDYLSAFRNQKPQKLSSAELAPVRTSLMCEFGFSNFKEYYSHLKNSTWSYTNSSAKENSNYASATATSAAFLDWVGNDMSLIVTEPAGKFIDNNVYACIRAKNVADALARLNAYRNETGKEGTTAGVNEEKYRSNIISSIGIRNIVPSIYGRTFSHITNCFYTGINDFIVFANQPASLKVLIDEVSEGKVLSKDSAFTVTENNLSATSNVKLYINPKRSENLFAPALVSFLQTVYNSSAIIAEWSYTGNNVNTGLTIGFHQKTLKQPVLLWSLQLDTVLSCSPVLVCGNREAMRVGRGEASAASMDCNFFAQDARNNLYKITESGAVIWKKNLGEKILSSIHPVDVYHDGRHQLIFNTDRKLYLVNLNGDNIGNFPIRLPALASNGCSVISTAGGYTIYVACSNNTIYAYDANGKPLIDWKYIHTDNIVAKPIKTFTVGSDSYLVISENNGAVAMYDRTGNSVESFKGMFAQSMSGESVLLKTDSTKAAKWVTTDTTGAVVEFSATGEIKTKRLDKFSSQHSFILDQSNKGQATIIYADADKVEAYDLLQNYSMKPPEKRWAISLPDIVPSTLFTMQLSNGETAYGVSSTRDLFYVLNQKGEIEKGFPVKGSLYPALTKNETGDSQDIPILLICGNHEGMVYVYKTE